ncbi:hypothetical protein GLOIN_2v1765153 [Rhizophagus irregularis DAOM 181602=DAOM 197198]|nr:hypothetical protein GLOIN_2v1765153 [Rhizophagus irregularis DAOM 181602=DAOM 197198]
MTKKHEKHEKHEKKKKSGKRYHSDIESSNSEKPEAKVRKTNKTVPKKQMDKQRQKPTLIDFVEDEERNIGIFRYIYVIMPEFIISPNDYEFKVLDKEKRTKRRQSESMKGQKGQKSGVIDLVDDDDNDLIQQDERDNDQTGMLLIVPGAGRRIESVDPENNERKEPIRIPITEKELIYPSLWNCKRIWSCRIIKKCPPPSSSSSSSSSSFSSPSPSPSSSFSSSNSSFFHYEEMDRDLRTALRNKIARIMDRLPEDKALNTRKTFDSQRKLVQNNIIPKRERRNKTIDKLKKLKDRLINKFHTNELRPLQTDNRYHSPEVSETDSDNPNKRKIIIRDLKWRSATLRSFLQNYVDNAASNARRVRKRVYDTEYAPNENMEKYSANREEVEDDKSQEDDDKIQEDDDKIQEDDDKSQEDDDKSQEDDDKSQEDDDKIQEDDDKSQEDDDKIQEDDDKSQEDDDKSQEDDDATGREKNEDQEKEQDEEVDYRKKRKKRSVSLVSEEYDSSDSSKSNKLRNNSYSFSEEEHSDEEYLSGERGEGEGSKDYESDNYDLLFSFLKRAIKTPLKRFFNVFQTGSEDLDFRVLNFDGDFKNRIDPGGKWRFFRSLWSLDLGSRFLAIKRRTALFRYVFRYDDFGRHFEPILDLLDAILVRSYLDALQILAE